MESASGTALTFAGVLLTSSAFLLAWGCRRFTSKIKHRWQAFSAGVAQAYVFIHVIPELEEHRQIVARSSVGTLFDAEKAFYLWVFAGFIVFVGLTRLQVGTVSDAFRSHRLNVLFWGEMAGYACYSLLLGYLLVHREDATVLSLALFVVAMGLHLLVVDNELDEKFQNSYRTRGPIVLASSLFAGWALGSIDAFPASFTSRMFAFVVGGVVITAAHEGLRGKGGGPFWWFLGGAAIYSILLLLI
jgi:hypothetical protein